MLDPVTFGALASVAKGLISRVWPDPAQQAEQLNKLAEIEQRGDLAELQAHVDLTTKQLDINIAEAQHASVFVAGARPFILWIGGVSLGWSGIIHPMLMWVWAFANIEGSPPPMIDGSALTAIVTGLLGLGGMRTFEKKHGVHTSQVK